MANALNSRFLVPRTVSCGPQIGQSWRKELPSGIIMLDRISAVFIFQIKYFAYTWVSRRFLPLASYHCYLCCRHERSDNFTRTVD